MKASETVAFCPRVDSQVNCETVLNDNKSASFDHIPQQRLKKTWVQFLRHLIGDPTYSFTLTMCPVHGARRSSTKINDAVSAMSWFVNVLNSRCTIGHDAQIGLEKTRAMMEKFGASEEDIEKTMASSAESMKKTGLKEILMGTGLGLIWDFVKSLLLTLVIRKEEKFEDQ